jgi:hypothetical protein
MLVVTLVRPDHEPVFSQGDRLRVAIVGYVPEGKNGHRTFSQALTPETHGACQRGYRPESAADTGRSVLRWAARLSEFASVRRSWCAEVQC